MEKSLKIILFVFLLSNSQQIKAGKILKEVGNLAFEAMQELASFYLGDPIYVVELFQAFTSGNIDDPNQINAQLDDISTKIDELSQNMLRFEREVMEKLDTLNGHSEMKNKLRDIYANVDRVNYLYEYGYLNYIKDSKVYLNNTKKNFAKKVLSLDDDGVSYPIERIHKLMLETDTTGKNIPMYYAEDNDLSRSIMCRKQQSAQRLIYNMYELIVMTEMKGIILLTYAYKFLLEFEDDHIKTFELDDAKYHQKKRMKITFEAFTRIAESASREIWSCDPKYHEIGITYEKFGPVFQKFVLFEGDIYPQARFEIRPQVNPYNSEYAFGTFIESSVRLAKICEKDCPALTFQNKLFCHSDLCKATPNKYLCKGHIHDCEYADKSLNICLAEDNDDRLYRSIRTSDGRTLGKGGNCSNTELTAPSQNGIGPFKNCDYCLCTCVDDSKRYIKKYVSAVPVFSDVYDNKVITGIQIVNVDDIFHIKIQQGTLLPKGRIARQSVEWKNVSAYGLDNENFERTFDYHEITWDQRTFFLDELESYDGHVLAGIQFSLDKNGNIKLAIYSSPFDLESGEINVDEAEWLDSSSFDVTEQRQELIPNKYGIPINYSKHEPDSQSNQFIKLTTSDSDEDAGQSVVPFFDTQPVTSTYPMPLSGAALIHKGHEGSAGFMALKVFTLDINQLTSN